MPLWNMTNANTGAPKYAPFGGLGVAANGNVLFANTQVNAFHAGVGLGVVAANNLSTGTGNVNGNVTHAGWVARTIGTGFVASIAVTNGGTGYTPGPGFITFSGGSSGVGANASFQVNAGGSIANVTLNAVGNSYNIAVTANAAVAYSTPAAFTVTMGGRTGRIQYETLVAAGNIA